MEQEWVSLQGLPGPGSCLLAARGRCRGANGNQISLLLKLPKVADYWVGLPFIFWIIGLSFGQHNRTLWERGARGRYTSEKASLGTREVRGDLAGCWDETERCSLGGGIAEMLRMQGREYLANGGLNGGDAFSRSEEPDTGCPRVVPVAGDGRDQAQHP